MLVLSGQFFDTTETLCSLEKLVNAFLGIGCEPPMLIRGKNVSACEYEDRTEDRTEAKKIRAKILMFFDCGCYELTGNGIDVHFLFHKGL